MFYYEVVPADRQYHSEKYLTYQHDGELETGQIVVVTLQTKNVTGFIIRRVAKPSFKTKSIVRLYPFSISPQHVQLFGWMHEYYPYGLGVTASLFTPPALPTRLPSKQRKSPMATLDTQTLPTLSRQQTLAVQGITNSPIQTHILHGDTGTGKTRIYIELAMQAIKSGKSAIILTPEISLTPQLIQRFREVFSRVHVMHSHLTPAQRRDTWHIISTTKEPQIIIGPRSALFLPVETIGLLVIDEFHDTSYKQEQAPRYSAIHVAAKLARLHGTKLVMGSATPPIDDYFYATQKGALVHRLTELPGDKSVKRTTKIIDLSVRSEKTNLPLISKTLLQEITHALENGGQVLIFHNKRGSARSVLCEHCGWFAHCKRCNVPYTYHADSHSFLCHTCGFGESTPNNCPECGSSEIFFKGPGTKTIAENLAKHFPKATIGRYDKDNTRLETFSANQAKIERGEIDILVGTQLLTKGHDLPKLSVVGVLLAESGLQFPEYNAQEKSYQLLHQIAGRVGRGHRPGTVILQTFNPSQKTLRAAEHKKNSWEQFYRDQLLERRTFGFPPFSYLLKIEIAKKNEKITQNTAQKVANDIQNNFPSAHIIGLAPSFIPRKAELWRWHILVSSASRSNLIDIIQSLPKSVSYDLEPVSLL